MDFLQSIIYGLISGLSEFLPISAGGHQAILLKLFGMNEANPLSTFFVHLGSLLAVFICCRPVFARLARELKITSRPAKGRRNREARTVYDVRLLKTALIPMLIGLLAYIFTSRLNANLIVLAIFMILNGIIVLVPEYMPLGNKTAKHMTVMDATGVGVAAALSAIPGISRVGAVCAFSLYRGADREHGLNWSLVLSFPALMLMLLFDLIAIFSAGFVGVTFGVFVGYFFAGFMAFLGAYCGILLIRFLTVRTGYVSFAYYSWGAALLALILYLTV